MNTPAPSDEPSPADSALAALFAAARSARPDTSRAAYGFETRLLARLRAESEERLGWREFAAWCWRLLPGLAALTLALIFLGSGPEAPAVDDPFLAAASQVAPADDETLAQWAAAEWLSPI